MFDAILITGYLIGMVYVLHLLTKHDYTDYFEEMKRLKRD